LRAEPQTPLVRWRDIEDDQRLVTAHPLLHTAIAHVAHYQIRNRGTVGGSLAHADPAAELPGIAVTCEGEITLLGPAGSRRYAPAIFSRGRYRHSAAGRDRHRAAPAEMVERPALGLAKICPA
jgi:carbon-monoxide dehydrogenase medium subunit